MEQLRQQTSRLEGAGQGAGPESAAVQPQSLPVRSVQVYRLLLHVHVHVCYYFLLYHRTGNFRSHGIFVIFAVAV